MKIFVPPAGLQQSHAMPVCLSGGTTAKQVDRWIGQINRTTTNLLFHQHGHIDYTASTNN